MGTHENHIEHNRTYRDRQKEKGLIRLSVWVPHDEVEDMREEAKQRVRDYLAAKRGVSLAPDPYAR